MLRYNGTSIRLNASGRDGYGWRGFDYGADQIFVMVQKFLLKRARRFKNQILCDLHFADVALMECSDFMQQLRSFKPQSLGCAVARRKSSTTLIFPLPPQACSGTFTIFLLYDPVYLNI
ncbi:unnamed protein product [Euphydryas editha]|uniref:Uncharacterized protein n=1 Tax=Euphydryas editha TaxID=104508 RepID=A0AAU9TXF0_EUPED|nr:unnamed protein product [Euphydryas editha]